LCNVHKNFLEISSLRAAKEVRFATKRVELYRILPVKDWRAFEVLPDGQFEL